MRGDGSRRKKIFLQGGNNYRKENEFHVVKCEWGKKEHHAIFNEESMEE